MSRGLGDVYKRQGIYSSRYADNDKGRIKRVLSELEGVHDLSLIHI